MTSKKPLLLQVFALHCTDIHIKIKDKIMTIIAKGTHNAKLNGAKAGEKPVHQQRGFEGHMNDWFAYILAKIASMDFKWYL
ncbi:hypothetical protein NC651_002496 [Populus alba x Populus x berolinensis]|nr:hypothetical protein NC651_002496 [Populus alba x Populus x berolinensis]